MLEQSCIENDNNLAAALQARERQGLTLLQYHLYRINGTMQLLGATQLHLLTEKLEGALAAGQISAESEMDLAEGIALLKQQVMAFSTAIEAYSKSIRG